MSKEDDALQYVTSRLHQYQSELNPLPYTREDMRVRLKASMLLMKAKRGDHEAEVDLLNLVDELVRERSSGRRGRPDRNMARDLQICLCIHIINTDYGVPTTRNEATDGRSACGIVSEALAKVGISLSEKRIANIWADNAWRR